MDVPEQLYGRITLRVLPLEFLQTAEARRHRRLRVFVMKGRKCCWCGREGTYLVEGKDSGGNVHIDLYDREFVLMTVDHIVPKSKGGWATLANLRPMCIRCNNRRGNKLEGETSKEDNRVEA